MKICLRLNVQVSLAIGSSPGLGANFCFIFNPCYKPAMHPMLSNDKKRIADILKAVYRYAMDFYRDLDKKPPAVVPKSAEFCSIAEEGIGAEAAIESFLERYAPFLSASAGPRYLGFVVGGSTPAAVAGDWLVSVFDQNATLVGDTAAPIVELETLQMARELLGLPNSFSGSFVSGATMSNFTGLAIARQWAGQRCGIDVAQKGAAALPKMILLSATPHSSTRKSLSMLGMGRDNLELLPCLPGREAMDVSALEQRLSADCDGPVIVIASAGTVNTVDFDDLEAIAALKSRFGFWLHVDAAFGAFAACSERYSHLVRGLECADSITIDFHKWLNVPYDSAIQLTAHRDLQMQVFQNSAAYLGSRETEIANFINITPENSRRFRALPAWMSLKAYGREGYREIVERDCELARILAEGLLELEGFIVLAPVNLNVVCFTFEAARRTAAEEQIQMFLSALTQDGVVFLSPTIYAGTPAVRAAFCNWQTSVSDVERALESIARVFRRLF